MLGALFGAGLLVLAGEELRAQRGSTPPPNTSDSGQAPRQTGHQAQRVEAPTDPRFQRQGPPVTPPGTGAPASPGGTADPAATQLSALAGCIREACELGPALCADQADLLTITRACDGSPSAGCAQAACNRLGELGCDEVSEVVEIVGACRANQGGTCLERACHLAGSLPCEERQTVLRLARACAGNVGDGCVRVSCNRAGAMACDTVDGVSRVAQACGARP